MTATSLCLASLLTLACMGNAKSVQRSDTQIAITQDVRPTSTAKCWGTFAPTASPVSVPDTPLRIAIFPKGFVPQQELAKPLPVVPPKPTQKTYKLAGHTYVESAWKTSRASWYEYGPFTAWCNGRWSESRWDFDQNKWVKSPRVKLYHPTWKGHSDWHKFNTYKYSIPTVAHRRHQLGTFVLFRYHGKEVIAMVTDRGPFVDDREWDLNPCLKTQLGFEGVHKVDSMVLRQID